MRLQGHLLDPFRRFGGQHEPHVQLMVARVVVRDLGEGVDLRCRPLEILGRDAQRRQAQATAQVFGVIHRAEAGQYAVIEQRIDARDQGRSSVPSSAATSA